MVHESRQESSKGASSLEERARTESRFFDHLVNLVPSKFYHTEDPVNMKFMKKSERDLLKKEYREQHKKSKREKLDPETAKSTLDVQKQKHGRPRLISNR